MTRKIVLAFPPDEFTVRPGQQVGLGLLYVAAVAEQAGHDVVVVQDGPDYEARLRLAVGGADVVGFTATCLDLPAVCDVAKNLAYPGTVIIGGPGPTTYPEYLDPYLDDGTFDAVFIGEAENTFVRFLDDLDGGEIKRQYRAGVLTDLNNVPLPARHLVARQGHGLMLDSDGASIGATVLASRGCPFDCHFCASRQMWGPRVRVRDPEDVRRELDELVHRYGVTELRITDDNLISDPSYAAEIFDILGSFDVPWRLSIRVKPHEPEMYESMRAKGCREVSFGIESFDPHVLEVLNKRATAEDNQAAIRNARAAGLVVRGLMIIGCPGETAATVDLNLEALRETPPTTVSLKTFIPLPGCAVWQEPERFGVTIVNRNLRDYNFWMYTRDGKQPVRPMILPDGWTTERYVAHVQRMRDGLEAMGLAHLG